MTPTFEFFKVELLVAQLIKEVSAFYDRPRHYRVHRIPSLVLGLSHTNSQPLFVKYISLNLFVIADNTACQTVGVDDDLIHEMVRTWKEAVAA